MRELVPHVARPAARSGWPVRPRGAGLGRRRNERRAEHELRRRASAGGARVLRCACPWDSGMSALGCRCASTARRAPSGMRPTHTRHAPTASLSRVPAPLRRLRPRRREGASYSAFTAVSETY
eukprot:1279076-Prymnesium_polylepis.1